MSEWIDSIVWNEDGLLPVVVQESKSKRVVMFAWMNRESLESSLEHKRAIYWSRSRKKLWMKGEESQNYQLIEEIYLDCDSDVLLLIIKQEGGISCHTGRVSCFLSESIFLLMRLRSKIRLLKILMICMRKKHDK